MKKNTRFFFFFSFQNGTAAAKKKSCANTSPFSAPLDRVAHASAKHTAAPFLFQNADFFVAVAVPAERARSRR